MEPFAILKPVLALGLWTFLVFLLIPVRRLRATARGELSAEDFRLGESARVPEAVALPNRNAMNLLQMPVLFYVACLLLLVAGLDDRVFVGLGWAYVGLRVLHSIVHVTYNNVSHRFVPFALSNVVLLAIWIRMTLSMP